MAAYDKSDSPCSKTRRQLQYAKEREEAGDEKLSLIERLMIVSGGRRLQGIRRRNSFISSSHAYSMPCRGDRVRFASSVAEITQAGRVTPC